MTPATPLVLRFGSPSGSWFAFCLFATLFGVLGWGVAREIRRRSDVANPIFGRGLGAALFLGPMWLIYASSLSGFYRAEVDGPTLRLHYLFPGMTSEIPVAEVATAAATPWYRARWRLVVVTTSGSKYESATWYREPIADSLARLNEVLRRPTSDSGGARR